MRNRRKNTALKNLIYIYLVFYSVISFAQDTPEKTFHLFTKTYNPDCSINFAGYVIGDDHEVHYFTNLQEFSLITLDVYGGKVKIYQKGADKAEIYRGFGDMKKMRTAIKELENGEYHFFFVLPGMNIVPDTIHVNKEIDCNELQKIEQKNSTADNIFLGTISKSALKVPHNRDFITYHPVRQLGIIKGHKFGISKGFKSAPHISLGLSFRMFDGITRDELNISNAAAKFEDKSVDPYNTFDLEFKLWPSLYSGVHIDFLGTYHTLNAFSYGARLGIQSRVNRYILLDYGASMHRTTIEGYVTSYFPAFYISVGLVYGYKKEKQFFENYRANKKAYRKHKKETRT